MTRQLLYGWDAPGYEGAVYGDGTIRLYGLADQAAPTAKEQRMEIVKALLLVDGWELEYITEDYGGLELTFREREK